jgi:prolyl-tRNA editing enzyme YbaK/EbsC (Cys-tRNA(Pro) deacylase)
MAQRTPEDVQAALAALGVESKVQHFTTPTATATQAAEAIGTTLGSIVKSLCFLVDGKPVLVLAAGDKQVDDRKLGTLYDVSRKKVKIADAETTIETTGFAPGGVSPVALAATIPIHIDQSLGRFETVYAAAGSPHAIFPIKLVELVRVTGGALIDVTRD